MKTKCQGYTVMNEKTGCFVDWDGRESDESYETWDTPEVALDVILEIAHYATKYNNKNSRRLKRNLKLGRYKVVRLDLTPVVVPTNGFDGFGTPDQTGI